MSAHPAHPSDFPRLALSIEREGDPAPTPAASSPEPQLNPHTPAPDSVTSSPVPLSTASPPPSPSSPSPLPPPRTSAHSAPSAFSPPSSFSEYLDTEFDNPARERLRRQAERRANPTDAQRAKQHELKHGYLDQGTPPPRLAIPHFNPSPEATTKILDAICDRTRSLTDIAAEHHTTFQVLTFFLSRPDIKERLDALTAAAVTRAHFFIADNLPAIAYFLMETLRSAHNDHDRSGYLPQTSKGFSLLLRSREDIRKTVSLLLRIGNYSTGPRQPRESRNTITRQPSTHEQPHNHAFPEAPSPREESANNHTRSIAPQTNAHQQTTTAPSSQANGLPCDSPGSSRFAAHPGIDRAEIPHAESVQQSTTPQSREHEEHVHHSCVDASVDSDADASSAFEANGLTNHSPGSSRPAATPGYTPHESSHAEGVQQTGAQPAANATDNPDATDTPADESPDEPARDPHRVAQIIGFVHEADPTALAGLSRAQFLALTKDANRIVCQQYGGDPRLLSREDFFTRFAQAIRFLRDARAEPKKSAADPP